MRHGAAIAPDRQLQPIDPVSKENIAQFALQDPAIEDLNDSELLQKRCRRWISHQQSEVVSSTASAGVIVKFRRWNSDKVQAVHLHGRRHDKQVLAAKRLPRYNDALPASMATHH